MAENDTVDHLFWGRTADSSVINLSVGAPGPDILSRLPPLFAAATDHRMAAEAATCAPLFQYGPEAGIASFRRSLADFLQRHYRLTEPPAADNLVVTAGATLGLQLACSVLLHRRAVVFVEDPTYFIALSILAGDLGLRVVAVPMTSAGVDVAALRAAVERERAVWRAAEEQPVSDQKKAMEDDQDGRFWGLFYTIPTCHNPTGITMTRETGLGVIDVARDNEIIVFADDVYNVLSYSTVVSPSSTAHDQPAGATEPLSRPFLLQSLDRHEVVVSNGSFSKILAPGVRLGWLQLPPRLLPRILTCGVLLSAGSINNYTSGIVNSMLQIRSCQLSTSCVDKSSCCCPSLLDMHVNNLKMEYGERMRLMCDYLEANLDPGWRMLRPAGGFFLWLEADRDLSCGFNRRLEAGGVVVLPGPATSSGKDDQQSNRGGFPRQVNCLRLCVAYYPREKLVEACKVICQLSRSPDSYT